MVRKSWTGNWYSKTIQPMKTGLTENMTYTTLLFAPLPARRS